MSLLDRIRKDAQAARTSRSSSATILTTLIGNADNAAKSGKTPKVLTDADVIAMIQSFLKGINETLESLSKASNQEAVATARSQAELERDTLQGYMPSQMSDQDIMAFAREQVAKGANLGGIMSALKADHQGRYDGKTASAIVRAALADAA